MTNIESQIHANVWQKPLQYYKVISLWLKLINLKNKINLNIKKKKESQMKSQLRFFELERIVFSGILF